MKGIVVTTDLEIRIEEFSDPLYKTVGSAVGGYIEHVKPARLRHPYCMIVNEEGRLLDLPLNYVGSYFLRHRPARRANRWQHRNHERRLPWWRA